MKISLNDKRVFIILGLLGLAVVYYNFIYSVQQKDIKKYTQSIEAYEEHGTDYDGLAVKVAGIDAELKIFNEKMKNIRSLFPPEIMQDDVLILIKKFSEESGFLIKSISFSEVREVKGSTVSSSTAVTKTVSGTDDKNEPDKKGESDSSGTKTTDTAAKSEKTTAKSGKTAAKTPQTIKNEKFLNALESLGIAYGQTLEPKSGNMAVADGKAYGMGINITGTSSNKQLKDFLYRIQNFTNKTSINNIQINSDNEGILSVTMEVEFYGIADSKAAAQENFFDVEWTPLEAAGKNDIFKPFEGYLSQNGQSAQENDNTSVQKPSEQIAYDFSMSVLSFGNNMSPPTVSLLGKSLLDDQGLMPIVYGDSRENEKVDLYLEAIQGKYYCKFKTDHETFPDAAYTNLARFEPAGDDIRMLIVSSKRTSTTDNAGAAITITNKTGKNLVIDVVDDDNNRPRVAINKSGNNVIVNYE